MRFYRVNAIAPLLLSKKLAGALSRSDLPGGGSIVAMADIHAMGLPRPGFIAYAMSKAALVEMVRALARELAPKVRVNGAAPGVVAWAPGEYEGNEAAQRAYLSRVPLERAGTPEDAGAVVRWLALEARYVTGQIIRVDGGRSLR
jgi:pteridine reductase